MNEILAFFYSNVYLDSILYSPLHHTFHNRLCILTNAFVSVSRYVFGAVPWNNLGHFL
jgi:hypothetical protein